MGKEEIERITRSAFLSPGAQHHLQQELLYRQAAYWLAEPNFFRQRLWDAGIQRPEDLLLSRLPDITPCTKEDLALHGNTMITPAASIADYCTTSGSTGHPVTVPLSFNDLERLGWNEAVSLMNIGLDRSDKLMLCTTTDRTFMAGLAYVEGARKMQIPMIRAGIGNPAVHWEYMRHFGATALIAVPSYLLKLLQYSRDMGLDPNTTAVRKILCIGEPLEDALGQPTPVVHKIREAWKVELYSTYASTEMQTAFTECSERQGGHHTPGLIITEFLDESGRVITDGSPGELTITHLEVEGLPLLRFRTGDICRYETTPCACGRHSLRIRTVIGRRNEMLKVHGTTLFPAAITEIMNVLPEISDYILVAQQDADGHDRIEVHYHTTAADEQWKLQVEARIRVKPVWVACSLQAIARIRDQRPSRKPLRFLDMRMRLSANHQNF